MDGSDEATILKMDIVNGSKVIVACNAAISVPVLFSSQNVIYREKVESKYFFVSTMGYFLNNCCKIGAHKLK